MSYTVAVSFDNFYENINLDGDYRSIANTRRDDIVKKLSKDFDILEAFSTGSIPKFTALKNSADVDIMVVLHYGKHIKDKTPTQVLQAVRNSLAEWKTGTRRNGQAVTLSYVTWPNADVVPVSRETDSQGNFQHYNVPNSNDDTWIPSKPKELAATIEAKSTECGPFFRRMIKMAKHWNRIHSDYLTSYHIEILAIRAINGEKSDLTWDVFQFFTEARKLLESFIYYDTGFTDSYLTWDNRQEALRRFDTAIDLSRRAWNLTYGANDDHKGAIALWKQMFGDKFPAYG